MNKHKQMTNCPNCSSNKISYDIKTESLKCNHCGYKVETKKVEKKIKELDTLKGLVINEKVKTVHKKHTELFGIKCTRCNAIKYIKDKTKYTYCRLCGNKEYEVITDNKEEAKYILPFLLNREEAYSKHKNALNKKYKYSEHKFLDNFKEENLIGVYVPFRIENNKYNCDMYGDAYATYRIHKSDNGTTYDSIKYRINRNVDIYAKDIYYERIDDDIATREDMLENIITEISPYDMKEKIELKKEYLEEYIILKPNETEVSNIARNDKLSNVAKYTVLDDILKYDYGIVWDIIECNILKTEISYVYIPIWLYYKSETKNNKTEYYYVAINGRTNEIGMHLPFNSTKAFFISIIKGIFTTFFASILFLIPLFFMYFGAATNKQNTVRFFCNIVLIILTILFTKATYKKIKGEYEGENIINENDRLIDYNRKILHRAENKIGKYHSGFSQISGRNDNFNQMK